MSCIYINKSRRHFLHISNILILMNLQRTHKNKNNDVIKNFVITKTMFPPGYHYMASWQLMHLDTWCVDCGQVHELPQNHCNDNQQGTLFSCFEYANVTQGSIENSNKSLNMLYISYKGFWIISLIVHIYLPGFWIYHSFKICQGSEYTRIYSLGYTCSSTPPS